MVSIFFSIFIYLFSPVMKVDYNASEIQEWKVINDGVMGGLSRGSTVSTEEGVLFSGNVSLANNGGFTSYRGPYRNYDLSAFNKLVIRYKSEGIAVAFQMSVDTRFYIPNYKIGLSNTTNEWVTTTYDLIDFKQYQLGNFTGKSFSQQNKKEIIRFGFITNEKKEGDFKFEIDFIEFK